MKWQWQHHCNSVVPVGASWVHIHAFGLRSFSVWLWPIVLRWGKDW